jgi:cytoskeletal protein CcmA (bactofilin family)
MAKDNRTESRELSDVVSIIGPGMQVVGDCTSDGVVRIEGRVEGVIRAAKSVVVGKDGFVTGDIETQDLIVAGRVAGTITAQT